MRHRRLRGPELALCDRVFAGTVPAERVLLTDLAAAGGRAVTLPVPGVGTVINLGRDYDDPLGTTGRRAPGQLLVHELAHAWQLAHTSALGFLVRGARLQVTTLRGDMGVYRYPAAPVAWGALNLEQQASVVDGWFAGSAGPPGPQHAWAPMSRASPWWPVVRDAVRGGL